MTAHFELKPLSAGPAAEHFLQILTQSFIADIDSERSDLTQVGYEHGRLLYCDGDLAGGLLLLPMAQWFGGRAVEMIGVASVAIAPHHRGRGAALALLQQCLQELHGQRVALSTLYPAAQQLYRHVGYGQAGTYCHWQVATRAIGIKHMPLPVQVLPPDLPQLRPLYEQQAQFQAGCLRRADALWQRLLSSQQQPLYCYGFGPTDALEGYVLFTQARTEHGSEIRIRDWVALSEAANISIWSFLNRYHSQIDRITWQGGAVDWRLRSLPEQTAVLKSCMRWMTRIVDLQQALLHRGYPPVNAELHLSVSDPLFAANNGRFILTVNQGQPAVEAGGRGEFELPINTLASLYTGLWSPQQLWQTGVLNAPASILPTAGLLFGGDGSPWMSDFF